jgi:2-keto-4-pentenoate hydratase/2-oxohepta-3-ene-1,7-dioic acid hydratase in catechol pathway
MKLATFVHRGQERLGAVLEDKVVDLAAAAEELKESRPREALSGMVAFLEAGPAARTLAESILHRVTAAKKPADAVLSLSEIALRPPVPRPKKLFALAGNYEEHVRETGGDTAGRERRSPRVFMKPPSTTLTAPGAPIAIPRIGRKIDWEVELAVVIGARTKYVTPAQAKEHIGGYTVLNDISERGFDPRPGQEYEEWDKFFNWLNGKWFDSFAPCGPWLVTADELDARSLRLQLRKNGETKQDSRTDRMTFDCAELVSWISQIVTLEPGDLIATGTPAGIGHPVGEYLHPGDVVEAEIEGIGVLRNPVVAE